MPIIDILAQLYCDIYIMLTKSGINSFLMAETLPCYNRTSTHVNNNNNDCLIPFKCHMKAMLMNVHNNTTLELAHLNRMHP